MANVEVKEVNGVKEWKRQRRLKNLMFGSVLMNL
jgi:hypothetical protein